MHGCGAAYAAQVLGHAAYLPGNNAAGRGNCIWPERYDHAKQGAFFDWFLVRSQESPVRLFRGDAIVLEAHQGNWWLFRRRK